MKNILMKIYNKLKANFIEEIIEQSKEEDISLSDMIIVEYIFLNEGVSIKNLVEKFDMSPSNLNYRLDLLIKKDILHKKQSKIDKREYKLYINSEFKKLYQKREKYIVSLNSRVKFRMDEEKYNKSKEMLLELEDEII